MSHKCNKKCYFIQKGAKDFLCKESGLKHSCYENCQQKYVNSEGMIICAFTGCCFHTMTQYHPYAKVQKNCPYLDPTPQKMKSRKRKRERNPFKSSKNEAFFKKALDTISMVLYSSVRSERNEQHTKDAKKQTTRQVKAYLQWCKEVGEPPAEKKIKGILLENKPKILTIETKSFQIVDKYAHKVLQLWHTLSTSKYAQTNKSIIHFHEFLIGSLYLMRSGIKYSKLEIHKDEFLQFMLPPIQDLKHYGVEIKSVTNGKKIIKLCLNTL